MDNDDFEELKVSDEQLAHIIKVLKGDDNEADDLVLLLEELKSRRIKEALGMVSAEVASKALDKLIADVTEDNIHPVILESDYLQTIEELKEEAEQYENRLYIQKMVVEQGIQRERDLIKQSKALIEDGERLASFIKPKSHHNCEDCWYSCPKSEDGCCDEQWGDECNCGADKWNKEIKPILEQHKALMDSINE